MFAPIDSVSLRLFSIPMILMTNIKAAESETTAHKKEHDFSAAFRSESSASKPNAMQIARTKSHARPERKRIGTQIRTKPPIVGKSINAPSLPPAVMTVSAMPAKTNVRRTTARKIRKIGDVCFIFYPCENILFSVMLQDIITTVFVVESCNFKQQIQVRAIIFYVNIFFLAVRF